MRKLLWSMVIVSGSLVAADATTPLMPYLPFRSVSENSARSMVGMGRFHHKVVGDTIVVKDDASAEALSKEGSWGKTKSFVKDTFTKKTVTTEQDKALYTKNAAVEMSSASTPLGNYGLFSVTPEYTRSFNGNAITNSLFGWWLQDCNKLKITGSEIEPRNKKDLLADWFYLDGAYEGSISFKPVIQNALVDMSFYCGMDAWVEGLYFRAHAPLTWTKWDLGARFKTTNAGVAEYPPVPPLAYSTVPLHSAESFFCKKGYSKKISIYTEQEIFVEPTYDPLTSARFCGCTCDDAKTLVRLSDIQADLGWDFLRRDRGHLGLYVRGVVPTGNRPTGRWLFEPVIGNGHHWELGGGLTASAVLWRNDANDASINFSFDAHATHMFDALQHRVFDVKDIPLSRYLPAFHSNNDELTPLANLTATTINSSFAAQGEIVAMFNATLKNWSMDLGYNFWAQTCEKIKCSSWANSCYGKNIIADGYSMELPDSTKWQLDYWSTIHEYLDPVVRELVTNSDLDYENARSKGMSHKVFGHVSYAWMNCDLAPFIGIGGEGEFGRNEKCGTKVCANSCVTASACQKTSCKNVSLSQWGVWLKGGISF